jgi:RNA polymerase sigma factor (sigma-70 family)
VDDDVLARAQAGSGDAFSAIWAEYAGPVAAYLRAKGMPDADDLTSEVFISVFTGIRQFTGDERQFRSWLFTIAHRRAIDHWRKVGRRPTESSYEPDTDERTTPSAEADAMDLVGAERVVDLLDQLTDEQREVLTLRIVADLTIEEVATAVGRKPGAIKALQRRGLATLRRILAKEGVSP